MPIYEYRRPDGTTFEVQQSFSDDALAVDPETGVPVERVLHAPAVHFKGKGFYNTDYGTRNRNRETAAAAAAEKSKPDTDSSKSDKAGSAASSASDTKGEASKGEASKGEASKPAKAKDSKPVAAKS
jgi:putative FmdB family regulatory protein